MSQDKNKDDFPWGDLTRLVNNTVDPKLRSAYVKMSTELDKTAFDIRNEHAEDMLNVSNEFNNLNQRFEEVMSLAEQLIQLEHEHHEDVEAINKRIDELELSSSNNIDSVLEQIESIKKQHQSDLTNITNKINSINNSVTNINTKIKVDPDGGIINGTGGLAVDFSKMPTDKMEALLKTIRVPIFLERNKNFYVDGSIGNDSTSIEGIGETPEKPFKTIQACVNYISTNYNINSRAVYIMVNDGTYSRFTLGDYTRTTGLIALRPYTGKEKNFGVIIADKNSTLCFCTAGTWYIYGFTFKGTYSYRDPETNQSREKLFYNLIQSNGKNSMLTLNCIHASVYWDNEFPYNGYNLRICGIVANNYGLVQLDNQWLWGYCTEEERLNYPFKSYLKFNVPKNSMTGVTTYAFFGEDGFAMIRMSTTTADYPSECKTFWVTGEFASIVYLNNGIWLFGGGSSVKPIVAADGIVTGQKYSINRLSRFDTSGKYSAYPGTIEGFVDRDRFCIIS